MLGAVRRRQRGLIGLAKVMAREGPGTSAPTSSARASCARRWSTTVPTIEALGISEGDVIKVCKGAVDGEFDDGRRRRDRLFFAATTPHRPVAGGEPRLVHAVPAPPIRRMDDLDLQVTVQARDWREQCTAQLVTVVETWGSAPPPGACWRCARTAWSSARSRAAASRTT
jgi:hypothetical protein